MPEMDCTQTIINSKKMVYSRYLGGDLWGALIRPYL